MRHCKEFFISLVVAFSVPVLAGGEPPFDHSNDSSYTPVATEDNFKPIDNKRVIKPGALRVVNISQTDVNMIQCEAGPITDRTYSEEKPLIYKSMAGNGGSFGFVKLQQQQLGEESLYYTKGIELYVTCGGEIYSLMLTPKPIETQHLLLSPGRGQVMQKNIDMFRELDIEDAAVTLIDKVQYDSELPASFSIAMADVNEEWKPIIPSVRARLVKSVKPEGIGLIVHEYMVYSKGDVPLNEFDFVGLKKNSFAVRMAKSHLKAKESTKVFVVERMWR